MASDFEQEQERIRKKAALYIEDALIVWSVIALFVLSVFFRHRLWGQVCLGAVFVVMAAVLWFRFRRVHRAFTGRDEPP